MNLSLLLATTATCYPPGHQQNVLNTKSKGEMAGGKYIPFFCLWTSHVHALAPDVLLGSAPIANQNQGGAWPKSGSCGLGCSLTDASQPPPQAGTPTQLAHLSSAGALVALCPSSRVSADTRVPLREPASALMMSC